MIHHISLLVCDIERSAYFFSLSLAPLGYKLLTKSEDRAGFGTDGVDGKHDLWIASGGQKSGPNSHSFSCLAFTATNKQMVHDFYAAAISAGGRDNGAPEYCPEYSPGYYAAYVLDPDGHNIEVVFDDPLV